MKFDWSEFGWLAFRKFKKNRHKELDYIGAVRVGDIKFELYAHGDNGNISYDVYIANEDYGYNVNKDGISYDFADGGEIEVTDKMNYMEFVVQAEARFNRFIREYTGTYRLIAHASNKLLRW